jgi:uroporphyrinogen-III decarboxylase
MSNPEDKIGREFKENYSSFQVGAKRIDDAMLGIADRVPVYAQMHEFAMHEVGISANKFYTSPEILTPAILEVAERYGFDAGFVDYDVYNIEAEALGQKVIFFEDHLPDVDRSTPLIVDPKDLDKIRTPDFNVAG